VCDPGVDQGLWKLAIQVSEVVNGWNTESRKGNAALPTLISFGE
jgi:hypothetical protein